MARMPVLGVAAPPEPAPADVEDPLLETAPPVEERRRRRGLLALLIVVILLVLAALITGGLLLTAPHRTPAVTNAPAHSSRPSASPTAVSPSPSPSPSTSSPSPSPSPTATTPSPSPSATTSASATGTPTSGQLADAVRNYFALLPGNTDAAWNRLTPSFQQGHAQGRDYFESFWGDYSSVTASDVQGASPDQVSATLTYVAKDGTRTVERDTFRLVRQGGVLKIDSQSTG
jgi:cytoskeletal protein RodZ